MPKVMEVLSTALRGAIVPEPGWELFVADYASIEARGVLWLAEDEEALEVFERAKTCPCRKDGRDACNECDAYCSMATEVFKYPTNKRDNPKERGVGKEAVLGLGYQMGAPKFVDRCALSGIIMPVDQECVVCGLESRDHRKVRTHEFEPEDPDEITGVKVVNAFRTKFWRVRDMWNDQEAAAIQAVLTPNVYVPCGKMLWIRQNGFLYCELPSGRRLAYPQPEIHEAETPWGEVRPKLTFMGVHPKNKQWSRQSAYGGLIVENQTQAVCRDLMMEAMVRAEDSGLYLPVLTVHDELIAEAPIGKGNVKEFEQLMAKAPEWADGFPIDAEGWSGPRYRK